MGGSAWVTLATNDSYSLGALVLAHSLKQTGTVHQLAVLVTPGVTSAMREKLSSVFNLVQEVNILDSRDEANLRLLKRPELGITFTKLHCWRLTQFDKCVFLDADTLVLKNSDELFEREELSAAPDVGWPDCFNSGVFVYRPSLETYDKLIQFALEKGSFDGGDQGLLNLFFSDWAHKDISKHLPFIYNLCSTACYSYLPAFKQFGKNAKIIHFIGAQKPWLQYFNTETKRVQPSGESSHLQEVLQLWWNIFCSLIHPHLSPAMQGQSQHGMSPSNFPPEFHPSPNPAASADDYESAWDPWDEYDEKISQNTNNSLSSTHYDQNQPIESLNTNTSPVANQPSIHSHSQSHNYSTYTVQNNSYYQPPNPTVVYQHIPRMPTPSPSPQEVYSPAQFRPSIQHREQNPQHHQETHQQPPQRHDAPNYPTEPQQHHHFHNESQFPQPEKFDHYDQPHVHDAEIHSHEEPQFNFTYQQPQVHRQFNSLSPVRSRSPKPFDQNPVLPNECEATTTVSNSRSLSVTIEENSSQEDAGLAGAFSQLTLGVPRTAEQDALENVLRKQAWEVGNIDYLGKDSFENIWSKISETLSAAPSQPEPAVAAEPELPSASAEPEIAPAESQSQTALQDVATPDLPPVPPIDPKVDSPESSPVQEPLISPSQPESVLPQPPLETVSAEAITQVAKESPVECASEIKQPDEPVSVEKEAEVKEAAAEVQVVAEKIDETVIAPLPAAGAAPPVSASAAPEPAPVVEASPVAPAAPIEPSIPEPKPAVTEAVAAPKPDTPATPADPVTEAIEAPKPDSAVTPAVAKTEAAVAPKPAASETPAVAEVPSTEPATVSAKAVTDAPIAVEPPVLEATPIAAVAAVPESPTAAEAAAKSLECPLKTKVVEATPPATPGTPPATPPVEKTKQALTAEATAPETPPPSEGASTPTPPPRKTDKPKKVAAKPKK